MTAYRVQLARLAAGHEDDESVEAEAGAILDAERDAEIHSLHTMIGAYLEAISKG